MIDIYGKINECRKQGKDLVLVTVTEKNGMGPADVGKKCLLLTLVKHLAPLVEVQ